MHPDESGRLQTRGCLRHVLQHSSAICLLFSVLKREDGRPSESYFAGDAMLVFDGYGLFAIEVGLIDRTGWCKDVLVLAALFDRAL